MELGLSLEDASTAVGLLNEAKPDRKMSGLDFCMALGLTRSSPAPDDEIESDDNNNNNNNNLLQQLNLVPALNVNPHHRIHSLHWSSDNGSSENGSSGNMALPPVVRRLDLDVNRIPAAEEVSSANSIRSPLFDRMCFSTLCPSGNKRSSKARDDEYEEENGMNARKKLRLSKQQSSFLEESFKDHKTLNPKQKLALAKQLNLRPRQVEVWFQNRRARTKLKQMEVDCDYLKRRSETLTEDNSRLQKELQELRALKTTNNILFHMKRSATTLTMCPSCQSVATTSAAAVPFPLTRPRSYPYSKNPDESS